ncbi:hypothetical protein HDU98_004806, partial [Podochytrium sp. JEL0797]
MDASILALLQGIQVQLTELKSNQNDFATRLSRIETSFTESQQNLILQTNTHLSAIESRLAYIESAVQSASHSMAANSM